MTKPLYSEGWTPFNSIFHAERSLATSEKARQQITVFEENSAQKKKQWQQKKLTKVKCEKKNSQFFGPKKVVI